MTRLLSALLLVLCAGSLCASAVSPSGEVMAADFGVTADGAAPCAAALQRAIDSLPSGGGVVRLPAGVMALEKTVTIPQRTVLLGQGDSWENTTSTFHVRHRDGPAFRMNSYSAVKGAAVYYPDNLTPEKMEKPDLYDAAFEIAGCNVSLEYIDIDGAWIGVSTPYPGGANAGQCYFANIKAFCHWRGFRLSGGLDVNRFENVHFFPSRIGPFTEKAYAAHHLIAFDFGRQDGATFNACFVIGAKCFFRQTLTARPDANESVISLGYAFTNCWIEAVDCGFDFRGVLGFTVLGCNVLVNKGGVGIRVLPEAIGFNGVIKDTQIRGFGDGAYTGIDHDYSGIYWKPFYTNKLTISDCVIQSASPAIRLGSKAQRVWVKDCLLMGTGEVPAVIIDEGADYIYLQDNLLQQPGKARPLLDMSSGANKVIAGNRTEKL
ncbi:MAG: hypothetical protein IK083_00510 [Abditibacteriota bacterium]|nr:hypothetical protein [Abditibacteriota bacterium]